MGEAAVATGNTPEEVVLVREWPAICWAGSVFSCEYGWVGRTAMPGFGTGLR